MNHLTGQHIQDYVEGKIPPEIEFHLRDCTSCRSNMLMYRRAENVLHNLPLEEVTPRFTDRTLRALGIKQSPSFAWFLVRNLAPVLALTFVLGIAYTVLDLTGAFQSADVQGSVSVSQRAYHAASSEVSKGIVALNDWIAHNLSFAFAKNTYGMTAFVVSLFGIVALVDKYVLRPIMKKKIRGLN